MKRPRLLVFDFDGTALGGHVPYAQFPPPFAAFLNGLRRRGMAWATNTVWHPEAQYEVIQRSDVRNPPACLTGQTGRILASVRNGVLVLDREHDKTIAKQDATFRERAWPRVRRTMQRLLRDDVVIRLAFDYYSPQCILDFTCRPGCEAAVWACLQPLLDSGDYYEFNPARSARATLLPRHMNKGVVLATIQKRLRVSAEETIVAGDGSNDLHMFDPGLARWMVCPANAEPLVKEHVRNQGGIVASKEYAWGVIEGVKRILQNAKKRQD